MAKLVHRRSELQASYIEHGYEGSIPIPAERIRSADTGAPDVQAP